MCSERCQHRAVDAGDRGRGKQNGELRPPSGVELVKVKLRDRRQGADQRAMSCARFEDDIAGTRLTGERCESGKVRRRRKLLIADLVFASHSMRRHGIDELREDCNLPQAADRLAELV